MPSASGRIDRRSRLRGRELSKIADSPGWVSATEHLFKTPRHVRGRRDSLPEGYSLPKTRRQTLAPPYLRLQACPLPDLDEASPERRKSDQSETSYSSKSKVQTDLPFDNECKSKMVSRNGKEKDKSSDKDSRKSKLSRQDPKRNGRGQLNGESESKSSATEKTKAVNGRSQKASEKRTSVSRRKPPADTRVSRRRNARLRPFAKRGDSESEEEEEEEEEEDDDDDDDGELRLTSVNTKKGRLSNMPVVNHRRDDSMDLDQSHDEDSDQATLSDGKVGNSQASLKDLSLNGSVLNDSNRCNIL